MSVELAPTPIQLLDQSPDAMIYAGPDGHIGYWNKAAEAIFGFPRTHALGQSLDIIIPEQFRSAHWTGFDRALGEGETKYRGKSLPTRAQHSSGATIYVELGFAIIRNEAGVPVGVLATARDITERFEQDRQLRRELRELKAAATGA